MITHVKQPKSHRTTSALHAEFLAMLPAIRRSAQVAFRKLPPELRHDLIAEVVANSYVAFARLVERGQADRASATPLARYAIAQVRVGRRVGNRLRIKDVLSQYAQFRKQFVVERLDVFQEDEGEWTQLLVEDRRATPADVAACRIDFAEWLRRLTARLRKIALALAAGETTSAAARMFGVSPAQDFPDSGFAETELGSIPKRSRDRRTTAAGRRMRRDMLQPALVSAVAGCCQFSLRAHTHLAVTITCVRLHFFKGTVHR